MDLKCENNPDGNVVLPKRQLKITVFVRKAYRNNFEVKQGDQDESFSPNVCRKTCVGNLEVGVMVKRRVCHLPFQWSGRKENITLRTAIFA